MPELKLFLLGHFRAEREREGNAVAEGAWGRPTARALVKLLAATPGHALHKEQITDFLWPDATPESGLNSFRKALHMARHALEQDLGSGRSSRYIHFANDMVSLNRELLWVDVDEFETAALASLENGDAASLEAALSLYSGELLPEDRYAEWAEERRSSLAELQRRLLLDLASALEAQGAMRAAVARLRQALEQDPTREDVARRLMLLLVRTGNRHDALRQYRMTREALQRELDVEPDDETEMLHAELLSGRSGQGSGASPAGPSTVAFPAPVRRLPSTQFVGRARAHEVLNEALRRAVEGSGDTILLAGEAGVGKTRLALEVAREAHQEGALVLWGASYAREGLFPYGAFIEAIDTYVATLPAPERDLLHDTYPELSLLLPSLSQMRSGSDERADTVRGERALLFGAIVRLLDELTGDRTLLLVLDDLHAAETESLQLIHHLARLADGRRWIIVGTYREEDVEAGSELQGLLSDLPREELGRRIRLLRLGQDDCNDLVEVLLPDGEPAPAVLEHLYERARGNPLFLHELIEYMREQGALVLDGAVWRLASARPMPVPPQVRDLIESRVDRMKENTRRILDLLSVVGMEGAFAELREARVLSGASVMHAEEEVLDALDEALHAQLLEERERTYAFNHPLVRAALYERLSRTRRSRLHELLGHAIEGMRPGDVETLAYHFAQSDRLDKALAYLEAAGDRARGIHANDAAIGYYTSAIERAEQAHDMELVSGLREKRADAATVIGRYAEAEEDYRSARDAESEIVRRLHLYRKEGSTWESRSEHERALCAYEMAEEEVGRQADSYEKEVAQAHAAVIIGRALTLQQYGRLDEAEAVARRALRMLGDRPSEVELGQVHTVLGNIAGYRRDIDSAEEHYRQALSIAERLGNEEGLIACWGNLSHIANLRGDPRRAEEYQLQGLAVAERVGNRRSIGLALNQLGVSAQDRGDYRLAEERFRQSLHIREEIGDLEGTAVAWFNLAEAALFEGSLDAAEEGCRRSLPLMQQIGSPFIPYVSALYGKIAHMRGQLDEAEAHYRKSLETREATGDGPGMVDCWIDLGELACDRGELCEASRLHRQARRIARGRGPDLETRAVVGMGRARLRGGRIRHAALYAEKAASLAEEHGFQRLVAQAALLRAAISVQRGDECAARKAADEALCIANEREMQIERGIALRLRGEAYLCAGKLVQAEESGRQSLVDLEDVGAALEVARTRVMLAAVLGRSDTAAAQHEAAHLAAAARDFFSACGAQADLRHPELTVPAIHG